MTDTEREKAIKFLRGIGLSARPDLEGDGIHSWRCEYPDRYGHCNCFNEVVDEFLKDWMERP